MDYWAWPPSTGEVLASARAARRITIATDLLIVATATATGRSLYTLDERQLRLAEAVGVVVFDPD